MPIKIKGTDVKNIRLTSNSVTKDLKKVGIAGKIPPVWESNRTLQIAFDPIQVTRIDYSLDGKKTWNSVYSNVTVSVPIGVTVYWYSIATGGFEEATPNEEYWALDDNTGMYPATVYKCTVGDKNLELSLGAVAIAYKIHIPQSIPGISNVAVLRARSNFGALGLLQDGDDVYKEDMLQITMTALPGYKILNGQETQVVYIENGNYTVYADTQRESYELQFINSPESAVQSGWYNGTTEVSSITCKFADKILYDTDTHTISVRDLDNSQIIGSATFKYTDDPTINEKVWISDVPTSMPAMVTRITGMIVKAGASEYSLNIKLDEGISKVTYQINGQAEKIVTTSKTILVESGSLVKLTATVKDGYTISGDSSKTITMGVADENVEFKSTLNNYTITFDLASSSTSTGSWWLDGTQIGSKATITLHHGDSLVRNGNTYNIVCNHSSTVSHIVEFKPDKVTGYSSVLTYSTETLTVTGNSTITVDVKLKGDAVTVAFHFNTGISKIKYTLNGGAETELAKSGSPTYKTFVTGDKLVVWAEALSGYTTFYNSSNKATINVSANSNVFDSKTTANSVSLTVKAIQYGSLTCSDGRSGTSLSIDANYNDTISDNGNTLTITKADGRTITVTYTITPEEGYDYSFNITNDSGQPYTTPHTKAQIIKFNGWRTPKTYNLTIKADKYTSKINYRLEGATSYSTVIPSASNDYSAKNIQVTFGSTVTYYGEAITGSSVSPNSSAPATFTVTHSPSGIVKTISGSLDKKTVTLNATGGKWSGTSGSLTTQTVEVDYGTSVSIDKTNKKVTIGSKVFTWVEPTIAEGQELVDDFNIVSTGSGSTITSNITITGSRSVRWKTYTFTWKVNNGITKIVYNLNGTEYTKWTNGSVTVTYGDELSAWAVQEQGYQAPNYNKSHKYVLVVDRDVYFSPRTEGLIEGTITFNVSGEGGRWYDYRDSSWYPLSPMSKNILAGDRILKEDNNFQIIRDTSAETLTIAELKFNKESITGYKTKDRYDWYVDSSNEGIFNDNTDEYQVWKSVIVTGYTIKEYANKYSVYVTLGDGISKVYAKSGSTTTSTTVTGNLPVQFEYGSTVELWADVTDASYNVPWHKYITVDLVNSVNFTAFKANVKVNFTGTDGAWVADSSGVDLDNTSVPYNTKYTVTNALDYVTVAIDKIATFIFFPNYSAGKTPVTSISPSSSGTITSATTFNASVRYDSNTYPVSIDVDNYIDQIWYKIDSGSWTRLVYTDNSGETSLRISHGSKLYSYAIAKTGYSTKYNSQWNYKTVTGTDGATGPITISHDTSLNTYTITFKTSGAGGSWSKYNTLKVNYGAKINITRGSSGVVEPTVTIQDGSSKYENTFKAPTTTDSVRYWISDITTTAVTVTSDVTVTGTSGSEVRKYDLYLTKGEGINKIYYSVDNGASYSEFTSSGGYVSVNAGAKVKIYGTTNDTNKYSPKYTISSPLAFDMPASNRNYIIGATVNTCSVTFKNSSLGGAWYWDASGNSQVTNLTLSFDYGTTWYSSDSSVIFSDGTVFYYSFPATPVGKIQTNSFFPESGTVNSAKTIEAVVSRDTKTYNYVLGKGEGTTEIKYRIGTSGTWTTYSSAVSVPHGSTLQAYVSGCSTGYESTWTESSPYTDSNITSADQATLSSKLKSISITLDTNGYGSWTETTTGGIDVSRPFTVLYGSSYSISGRTVNVGPYSFYYNIPSNNNTYNYSFTSISNSTVSSSGKVTGSIGFVGNSKRELVFYKFRVYLGTGIAKVVVSGAESQTITTQNSWVEVTGITYNALVTLTPTILVGYTLKPECGTTTVRITSNSQEYAFYATRNMTSLKFTVASNNNAGGYWSLDSTSYGDAGSLTVPTASTWTKSGNSFIIKDGGNVLFTATLVQGSEAHYTYSVSYEPSESRGTISDTTIKATTNRTLRQYTITFNASGYGGSWSQYTSKTLPEGTSWSIASNYCSISGQPTNYFYAPSNTSAYEYINNGVSSSTGARSGTLYSNITITGNSSRSTRYYSVHFSIAGSQLAHAYWDSTAPISAPYGAMVSITSGSSSGRGYSTTVSVGGQTRTLIKHGTTVIGGHYEGDSSNLHWVTDYGYYSHSISNAGGNISGDRSIIATITN